MFSIATNHVKKKVPQVPFLDIAKTILGPNYDLSLVFAGPTLSRRLNHTYRAKNKPTNILSFPLTKKQGEIFLNLTQAEIEAKKLGESLTAWTKFLFIHGCLHLKGYEHSAKMERQEQKFFKLFSSSKHLDCKRPLKNVPTNHHRN